jgi:hypothetical protein
MPTRNIPSAINLGADQFGDRELGLADLDRLGAAAGVDVAADVVLRGDAAQGGIFVADLQRPAVHQEHADVALLRRRHIGL